MTGVCTHPPAEAGGCHITCSSDDDCHPIGSTATYKCLDGNCADITSTPFIIRLTHAEVGFNGCPENHAKLEMRFFMDSLPSNGYFHIPLTEQIISIYPDLQAFDVDSDLYGSGVRTYFSMRTTCKDLTLDCYPFVNNEFEFIVKRFPCHDLGGAHCLMDDPEVTHVMLPLTVIDCPFDEYRLVSALPVLTVEQEDLTVNASLSLQNADAWITDIALCIPEQGTMLECIANEAETCPFRGCFDTPSIYFYEIVYFMRGSNYTGAMTAYSSQYSAELARGYENYNGDRCGEVDAVDWFKFSLSPLLPQWEGLTAVLDIKYEVPTCQRRLGRKLSSESRSIGVFQL